MDTVRMNERRRITPEEVIAMMREGGLESRDYQTRIICGICNNFLEGCTSILLESPTGSGKSAMGLTALKLMEKILPDLTFGWVAMRRKLLAQAKQENERIGVTDIHFVSMFDKNPPKCDVIVTDEAQHDSAATCADLHKAMEAKYSLGLSVGGDSKVLVYSHKTDEYKLWRIDEFCESLNAPDGQFLPVADYSVRAFDGKSFVWKNLKAILKHKVGSKKCFRIRTEFGRDLLVTEDHSVFRIVSDGRKAGKPIARLECVRSSSLEVGDFLLQEDATTTFLIDPPEQFFMPDFIKGTRWKVAGDFLDDINTIIQEPNYKHPHKVRYTRKHGKYGSYLTHDEYLDLVDDKEGLIYHDGPESWCRTHVPISVMAYFIGYYLGDGWVDGTRVNFAVAKEDADAFLQKLTILDPFFYLNPQKDPAQGESYEIRISNKYLSDFFRKLTPGRAQTKTIPECVYNWSDENVRLLIQGINDSDGSFSKTRKRRDRYYVNTTSKALADNLIELLKRFGVVASCSKRPPQKGGVYKGRQIVGKHPSYIIHFSAHAFNGMNKGVLGRRKKFLQDFAGQPVKILSITPEKTKYVYDFSVDDDKWQTFVASGFLVHNTATPFRTDRVKLAYEKIIRDCGVRFLIEEGYLAPFSQYVIPEWSPEEIAKQLILTPERWGKSVVYFKNSELCWDLQARLQAGGITSAVMLGSHSMERRETAFDGFDTGKIQVLINVHLLTEGFDSPDLQTVWVRDSVKLPTMQMAGRSLRKDPDNPNKVAQIVQSDKTTWPYPKCVNVKPDKQFIWRDEEWRSLDPSERVEEMMRQVQQMILTKPRFLPAYLTNPNKRIASMRIEENGSIKYNQSTSRANGMLTLEDAMEDDDDE
jgi:intein/homing endonuclease